MRSPKSNQRSLLRAFDNNVFTGLPDDAQAELQSAYTLETKGRISLESGEPDNALVAFVSALNVKQKLIPNFVAHHLPALFGIHASLKRGASSPLTLSDIEADIVSVLTLVLGNNAISTTATFEKACQVAADHMDEKFKTRTVGIDTWTQHTLNHQRIVPIGISTGHFTSWRNINDYSRKEVPSVPGIYMLRCVDEDGHPIKHNVAGISDVAWRNRTDAHLLQGVIYIGLAGRKIGQGIHPSKNTLKERFGGNILLSWQVGAKPRIDGSWAHGSRAHYENKNDEFKKAFPIDRIQACFEPMVPSAWLKSVPRDVQEIIYAYDWNKANEYVVYKEAYLIQRFKKLFGNIPPLNDKEEDNGPKMSDAKFETHLKLVGQDLNSANIINLSEDGDVEIFISSVIVSDFTKELAKAGFAFQISGDNAASIDSPSIDTDNANFIHRKTQIAKPVSFDDVDAAAISETKSEETSVTIIQPDVDKLSSLMNDFIIRIASALPESGEE